MENEEALRLFREGGTLLCLDVPPGSEFGINQHAWSTGPLFKGVKMIPLGLHFIHWKNVANNECVISGESAERVQVVSENGSNSFLPMLGHFIFLDKPHQVLVFRWSPEIEDLLPLDEIENERYANGVRIMDFDRNLAPFSFGENYKKWKSLTNMINQERLAPSTSWMKGSSIQDYQFECIPKRWIPKEDASCIGADRTKYFVDKSYLLYHLIQDRYGSWDNMMGEFQLSFVCFWLAEHYEAFEFWKEMMVVLCNCESSILEHPTYWENIIDIIRAQMDIIPEDFFADILSGNNFLVPSFRSLLSLLGQVPRNTPLYNKFQCFKNTLETRFKMSFKEEEFLSDDEDAPIVVDLYED